MKHNRLIDIISIEFMYYFFSPFVSFHTVADATKSSGEYSEFQRKNCLFLLDSADDIYRLLARPSQQLHTQRNEGKSEAKWKQYVYREWKMLNHHESENKTVIGRLSIYIENSSTHSCITWCVCIISVDNFSVAQSQPKRIAFFYFLIFCWPKS